MLPQINFYYNPIAFEIEMQDLPIIQLKLCKLKIDPFLSTNDIYVYSFGKHFLLQDFALKYPYLLTTTYICEYLYIF